jgi:CheY-like chemotaxis protein
MLKPYGINVECVTSGQEAVKRVRDEKPRYNAIFMDHMMPGMDGIETVKVIRSIDNDYAKNIPIIALTANALLGNDSLFLENGFQAFLSKPIDILRLDSILNNWIRDKTQQRRWISPRKNGKAAGPFGGRIVGGLDMAQGLARFDNDEEAYLRILQSFIVHAPSHIETAKAVDKAGLEDYRIAVHSFKGSSRSLGAGEAGNLAEALERAAQAGDWSFIEAHNGPFIQAAEELLAGIAAFLQSRQEEAPKPELADPPEELMAALLRASGNYDMAALKGIIETLDSHSYRSQPGLTAWLREQAGKSNFGEILRRFGGPGAAKNGGT